MVIWGDDNCFIPAVLSRHLIAIRFAIKICLTRGYYDQTFWHVARQLGSRRARTLEIDLLGVRLRVVLERVPAGAIAEWGLV